MPRIVGYIVIVLTHVRTHMPRIVGYIVMLFQVLQLIIMMDYIYFYLRRSLWCRWSR